MSEELKIIEIEPGTSGKADVLEQAIIGVIYQDEFNQMTLAETIGVLEGVKLAMALEARKK